MVLHTDLKELMQTGSWVSEKSQVPTSVDSKIVLYTELIQTASQVSVYICSVNFYTKNTQTDNCLSYLFIKDVP